VTVRDGEWEVARRRRFAPEDEARAAAAQAGLAEGLRALRDVRWPFLGAPPTPADAEAWIRRDRGGPGVESDVPAPPSPGDHDDGEIHVRSAAALLTAYARGELSPVDVLEHTLDRIARVDGALGSVHRLCADTARAAAAESARRWRRDEARPLEGIPFGVKDIVATADIRTTGGSVRYDHVPQRSATAVQRILDAGGVLVAKLSTPELAFGDARAGHEVTNPWSADHWCGGSSSGPAVALAARLVPVAVGTDTGGSIRVPSSYCGVTGLKPTQGRVPRDGVLPVSWTLDHTGPMARTAEDVARLLAVMGGTRVAGSLDADLHGVRIGVPRQWFLDGCADDVLAAHDATLRVLERAGAEVLEVDLPHAHLAGTIAWVVTVAEFASFHDVGPDELADFTPAAAERLVGGSVLSASDYLRALRARTLVQHDFELAWEHVDVIASPATPTPAVRLRPELDPVFTQGDRAWLESIARNLLVHNVTGMPALVMPSGWSADGLPLGVQIAAPPLAEARCLRLALAHQAATDHHLRVPAGLR
jgi:aspartyl-tRNA(Asn)/glutamyl-tRNA(Gln) amidotransferase subunit A